MSYLTSSTDYSCAVVLDMVTEDESLKLFIKILFSLIEQYDEDERIHNHVRDQFPYNFYVSFVKDHIALNPIETTTLDGPCFIKSNI